MSLTINWDRIGILSCKTVRVSRVSAEVRHQRMAKIGHLLTPPAIVKTDGKRIVPATPKKRRAA